MECTKRMLYLNTVYGVIKEAIQMHAATSKVTSKGQIVIPKKIREKYGIYPSTPIKWVEKKEGILMVPETEDPIIAARGMLSGTGVLKAYLEEKTKDKKMEEKKIAGTK